MSTRGKAVRPSRKIAKTKRKLHTYNELAKIESISKDWGLDESQRQIWINNIKKGVTTTKGRGKYKREVISKRGLKKAMKAVIALDVKFTGGRNVIDGIETSRTIIKRGRLKQVKFKNKLIYDKRSLKYKKSIRAITKGFKNDQEVLESGLKISTRARNIYKSLKTSKLKKEFVKSWVSGKNKELVQAGMLTQKRIKVIDTVKTAYIQELTRGESSYLNKLLDIKEQKDKKLLDDETKRAVVEAGLDKEINSAQRMLEEGLEAYGVWKELSEEQKASIKEVADTPEDFMKKVLRQGQADAEWYNDNRQLIMAYNETKNEKLGELLNEAKIMWEGNKELYDNWLENELPEILEGI